MPPLPLLPPLYSNAAAAASRPIVDGAQGRAWTAVAHMATAGAGDTSGDASVSLTNLDRQISELLDCKPLTEKEVGKQRIDPKRLRPCVTAPYYALTHTLTTLSLHPRYTLSTPLTTPFLTLRTSHAPQVEMLCEKAREVTSSTTLT